MVESDVVHLESTMNSGENSGVCGRLGDGALSDPRFHRRPSSTLAFSSTSLCSPFSFTFHQPAHLFLSNESAFNEPSARSHFVSSSAILASQSYKIMTSTSSTPDISTLSLSHKPSQQRLHDTYDYEGNGSGNGRNPYHFSTSPPIPAQSQYNPLNLSQSPLKNKTMRGGLPSVSRLHRMT